MQKFAIFTIILTMVVVVVVSEIVVNDYLPSLEKDEASAEEMTLDLPNSLDLSKSLETSSLGADGGLNNYLGSDVAPGEEIRIEDEFLEEDPIVSEIGLSNYADLIGEDIEESEVNGSVPVESIEQSIEGSSDVVDFEDITSQPSVSRAPSIYLREEQIRSAGFASGYLEDEENDGTIYKTIRIDDIADVTLNKTVIRTQDELLAKVYVVSVGIQANINDVYDALKTRAGAGLGIEINETNEYGIASFFINDSSRPNTAFLTVRVGGLIYGFSYPKEYHAQIKNLVQLLMWELS